MTFSHSLQLWAIGVGVVVLIALSLVALFTYRRRRAAEEVERSIPHFDLEKRLAQLGQSAAGLQANPLEKIA